MRRHLLLFIFVCFCFFAGSAQVVSVTNPTNTTPNLAATYASLANAITALNGVTAVNGPVTITLNAGNPQTAPAGGYAISFPAATSAANNIVIQGNNNVITTNSTLTTGVMTDAVFKLIGVDFVTIQQFVMQENSLNIVTGAPSPSNGTTGNRMTEWGVALLHSSPTNGAQNNIIQNNTISLNRSYQNTFGIYSNARHSATVVTAGDEVTNNTTGPNHGNKVYGNSISNVNHGIALVGSGTDANMDIGNEIGGTTPDKGNTITNWGSNLIASPTFFSASGSIFGIFSNNQKDDRISYNSFTSAALSGAPPSGGFRGIYKDYSNPPSSGNFNSNITNNGITLSNGYSSGITSFFGIDCGGISAPSANVTINVSNNSLLDLSVLNNVTTPIVGIRTTLQVSTLNINGNTLRGFTTAGTGAYTGITNNGVVTSALNINNNNLGDAVSDAITYSVATSSNLIGITVPTISATAALSISGNNFKGFTQNTAGSGTHTYITYIHALSGATDNINGNTFTNLVANTTGNVTFINRSGNMAASSSATENINSNSIVGGFTKQQQGGTVTLLNASSTSNAGNSMTQTGNNFSNITISGTTIMAGWVNTDGSGTTGGPVKTISNNTFSNWTCGSGATTVINQNNGTSGTSVSSNNINGISGSGSIVGISYSNTSRGATHTVNNNVITGLSSSASAVNGFSGGSPNVATLEFSGNTIGAFSSNAAATSAGVNITACAGLVFSKNKVSDITVNSGTGLLYGASIVLTAAGTATISNNLIGDLKAPNGSVDNQVIGLRLSSGAASTSFLVYYNTVYLNTSSAVSGLGTSALSATSSGTATVGNLTLRNNIIINNSSPNGTGTMVAYRRTNAPFTNFNNASNNNIFYGGAPAANRLIFFDGTNSDQTLAAFKTRVGPTRESASFTELTGFLSTTGLGANFLHIDPAAPTQAESGAVNISGFTDDYDGDVRQGNLGYTGTGTAPDIGADELEGTYTELVPPVIGFTALSSPTCNSSNQTITGVTITDNFFGVPTSGANRPRIYYRKNADAWFSQPGTLTSGSGTNGTWSFTIVVADMGGVTGGDVVSYYIIAEDQAQTPNVASNAAAGLVAIGVNNVTTPPSSPNSYTLNYTLNGTYTIGSGGNFATLTAAVSAYNNACAISGPVVFELIDNSYTTPSETFPVIINNHPDASAVNTLTIRPSATATPQVTGNTANPIIRFNGARFAGLDGRQSGAGSVRSLTVTNNGVSGNTIEFVSDALNDFIRYCVLRNSSNAVIRATVAFGTASGTGNDNHQIEFNEFADGAGTPANAIYSSGTVGRENSNITISGNLIHDYFSPTVRSCGIYLAGNSSNWTISNNRFYQTVARHKSNNTDHYGMWIVGGEAYTISGNIIGFADENGNGRTILTGVAGGIAGFPDNYSPAVSFGQRFFGMVVDFNPLGATSTINANIISGIALFTSSSIVAAPGIFCGIYQEDGSSLIENNIIGSQNGTGNIYVAGTVNGTMAYGIRAGSTISTTIRQNTVAGMTISGATSTTGIGWTGISTGGSASVIVSENLIGNNQPGNIRQGFFTNGANLSVNGTPASCTGGSMTGLSITSTGISISSGQNTLQGWLTSSTTAAVSGVQGTGTASVSTTSIDFQNNLLGTTGNFWLTYDQPNSGTLRGIYLATGNVASYTLSRNEIRGIQYNSATLNTGPVQLVAIDASPAGINSINVSHNLFINLSLRSESTINCVYASPVLTANSTLAVDSNRVSGTLTISGGASSVVSLMRLSSPATEAARIFIRGNSFEQVNSSGAIASIYGIYDDINGAPDFTKPNKTITGNRLGNWTISGATSTIGIFSGFASGSTSQVNQNLVEAISSGGGNVVGIHAFSTGQYFECSRNLVNTLSSADGDVSGLLYAGNIPASSTRFKADSNVVHSLQSSGITAQVNGISSFDGTGFCERMDLTRNRIYNLEAAGANAVVRGVLIEVSDVAAYNNLIGDLRTPNASLSGSPSVRAIGIEGSTATAKLDVNTIHLAASGAIGSLNSAAVFYEASLFKNLTLTNNILQNLSDPGASGKTAALWFDAPFFNTYSGNRNCYYPGAASSQRVIYTDGINSDQTLAGFQARVGPVRDQFSVGLAPSFISTSGADPFFLHLNTTGNCGLLGGGLNETPVTTDVDGDPRSTWNPLIIDIGADEVSKPQTWTGTSNDSWSNPLNWSSGTVPNSALFQVLIPAGSPNMPRINVGEVFQVRDIRFESGATLNNQGTLQVAGIISAAGTSHINNLQAGVALGSLRFTDNCGQSSTLEGGVLVSNTVNNLITETDLTIPTVIDQRVQVAGTLSFGGASGKTLNTGNNLVLLSSANATAGIADITGNVIDGEVTVQRFINTGTAPGAHGKTWQLLAAPTIGQTIFNAWQEAGNNAPGFGTWITGTGTGFDATSSLPSLKFYNPVANNWTGVTNTANSVNNGIGYMLFVRGDRTVTTVGGTPVPTILRSKGTVYQPNNPPPDVPVQANRFATVSNPYPSAIDLIYMRDNGLFQNLNNDVQVWDPTLGGTFGFGGYQTLASANDYEPTAGGTNYYPAGVPSPFIQSGQAFFVRSSGPAGSVSFNEACKENSSRLVHRSGNKQKSYFRVTLRQADGRVIDGNAVVYATDYSNRIDKDDAIKLRNDGEGMAVWSSETELSVEARRNLIRTDTIFYRLTGLRRQTYQLAFAPRSIREKEIEAWLVDRVGMRQTRISLDDSSFVSFQVTNDPASAAMDRFYVIFKRAKRVQPAGPMKDEVARPAIATSGKNGVYPNPVVNGKTTLRFDGEAGEYRLSLIDAGGRIAWSGAIQQVQTDMMHLLDFGRYQAAGMYRLVIQQKDLPPVEIGIVIP